MSIELPPAVETVPPAEKTAGNRRGALVALLAGSALGLAALGATPSVESARGKKGKKGKKRKGNKGGTGTEDSLPSVRYVYKSTTFTEDGVGTASSTCPSGYLPIGAGIWSSISEPVILSSLPLLNSNSWEFELGGVQAQREATVIAICLAATDDTTVEDTEHRTAPRKRGKRGHKK